MELMSKEVSRKGAKTQKEDAKVPHLPFGGGYFSARRGLFRLCAFAPLRELNASRSLVAAILLTTVFSQMTTKTSFAQTDASGPSLTGSATQNPNLSHYVDQTNGMTADDAVTYALAHNGDLLAARKEIDAARGIVKQARLRATPKLDIEGTRQIIGPDNTIMATAMLPLELGGRRAARIAVAEQEVEVRER